MSDSPVFVLLGATGGIGSALARRLSAEGARLVVGARRPEPLAELAAETGGTAFTLDATAYEGVRSLVHHAREAHGRVDGVVNLVGSILLKPAHLLSPDEFDETLKLNLHSAFYAVKAGVEAMRANRDPRGGSIVLMASVAARLGLANHEAIAAAKAGVLGLTRAAAASYAKQQIRVNAVAPGLVRTPLAGRLVATEEAEAASAQMHPLGRIGEPEDLAPAIAFLLDRDASGWMTGETVSLDGGFASVRPR